jgi:exonuclease VII small subunit
MDRLDVAANKSFENEIDKLKQRVARLEQIILRMPEIVTAEEREFIAEILRNK